MFSAIALLLASAPRPAAADITSDRVEFASYGRMGIAWTPTGQVIAGKYMNLGQRRAIGGRLEESDYLQPGIRFHLLKPEKEGGTSVDLFSDFEIFSFNGGIVSDLANGDLDDIRIMPLQFYIEAKNVLTPGLTLWVGSNLYRKNDIHICDYFYFNSLSGQGVGAYYGGLDIAVLTQTGAGDFFTHDFNAGLPPPAEPDIVQRQRAMFIGQYKVPFGAGTTYVQGLGEFHVVPKAQDADREAPDDVDPTDWGAVGGVKVHLDLGNDNFSDAAVRVGNRIANGAESGGSTFNTFGLPSDDGTYSGALGIAAVEHFLWNVGNITSINGYGVIHYSRGGTDNDLDVPNDRLDYSFGARATTYLSDQLHLITEGTFQARKDEDLDTGTAVKLAVAPTIVPSGERSSWTRPQIRLIYLIGLFNDAAVDQRMSAYPRTVGDEKVAHFVGARTEWWY